MSSELTCPVCHFEHIPRDRDSCPQCDSDLVCFKLLDALPDFPGDSLADLPKDAQPAGQQESGPDTDKRAKSKAPGLPVVLVVIILLIIACLLGYTTHRFSAIQTLVQKLNTDMVLVQDTLHKNPTTIIKTIEEGTRQMGYLKKCVEELVVATKNHEIRLTRIIPEKTTAPEGEMGTLQTINKPEAPCFNTYRATDKDTLWTIARDFYGSGIFYPVLMEHNPDISVYSISSRDTLRYLCDKTRVAGIYKAITGRKQKRPFWNYTVRSGETRKTIIKRYCLNEQDCLIEDKPLEPGMTIGVFLE